jgi:succinate dehydrogenase/fumarate reductase flavoprotein subunit
MTITYALMEKLEEIAQKEPHKARIITKARVTRLLKEGDAVIGCEYEKEGKVGTEYGPVILATGGYGADFEENGLIKKYRYEI